MGNTLAAASTLTADIRSNLNGGGGGNKVRISDLLPHCRAFKLRAGAHSFSVIPRADTCRVANSPEETCLSLVNVSCVPHAP